MGTLSLEVEKGLYLGIDFGTTNSVVSIYHYDEEEVHTLPIDGSSLFPTVVQFEASSDDSDQLESIYGLEAKESAIIYPESTVLSVKRCLGTRESIPIIVNDKVYEFPPEEIVALILSYLKERADEYIRENLGITGEFSGCVITVPANSSDKQKNKTKEAAIKAGFDKESVFLRLEPAAAAIEYAQHLQNNKTFMIYDFGGGTFDACLLRIQDSREHEPEISILSTYGDNHLGGNDIDKIVMDMIYEEFRRITDHKIDLFDFNIDDGVSKKQKTMAILRMSQLATQAKEKLSSTQSTKIVMAPFLQEPKIVNIQMEITRQAFLNHKRVNQLDDSQEEFDTMKNKSVIDLIKETLDCMDQCIRAGNLTVDDIDEVFLVGGSSSIPEVKKQITQKFGKEPYQTQISPAFGISRGAAVYCNRIMLPTVKGPKMTEKTIHPIGLEISGRRFLEIVSDGLEIPKEGLVVEADELLETNFDSITSMAIVVYEDVKPEKNKRLKFVYEEGMKRLAGTMLREIPTNHKGHEKVKVIFQIGQDNILTVKAKSMSTDGVETKLSVDQLY